MLDAIIEREVLRSHRQFFKVLDAMIEREVLIFHCVFRCYPGMCHCGGIFNVYYL